MGVYGKTIFSEDEFNDQLKLLKKELFILDNHLKDKTFFFGSKLTLADISIAIHLLVPF